MSLAGHLKKVAEDNGLDFFSDGRQDSDRGMTARPTRFTLSLEYGGKGIYSFSVNVSFSGAEVEGDVPFDLLNKITRQIRKDQTAGGLVSQVEIGEWNAVDQDKGLTTFTCLVSFKE